MLRTASLCFLALMMAACDPKSPKLPAQSSDGPKPETPIQASNDSDPKWLLRNTPNAKVAVVFVHGFIGDTIATWQNNDKVDFYKYVDSVPELKGKIDYFAFGFTSTMLAQGSLSVPEAANKMRSSLLTNGVLDYSAVVFVTHSMGGLVTLRFLINNKDLSADKVPLVVMYATPQEGSDIAGIAQHLTQNRAIDQLVPGNRNTFLQTLEQDWSNRESKPVIKCGYETKDTGPVRIVTRLSATRYCGGSAEPIENASHVSIVKPDRTEHPSVVLLHAALKEHVIGKQLSSKLELPDFDRDGEHLKLTVPEDYASARIVNAGAKPMRYWFKSLTPADAIFLRPSHTPRSLAGNATEEISVSFSSRVFRYMEPEKEFSFILETDSAGRESQKVVLAINRESLQQSVAKTNQRTRTEFAQAVNREANTMIDGIGSGTKRPELAELAYQAVANTNKSVQKMPESARWLVTADFLASAGMSDAATVALRRAETKDAQIADLPSAQAIAKQVTFDSGVTTVFKGRSTLLHPDEKESFEPRKGGLRAVEDLEPLARELNRVVEYQKDAVRVQQSVTKIKGVEASELTKRDDGMVRIKPSPSLSEIEAIRKSPVPGSDQSEAIKAWKSKSPASAGGLTEQFSIPKEVQKQNRP